MEFQALDLLTPESKPAPSESKGAPPLTKSKRKTTLRAVPVPNIHVTISGSVVAVYAAVVSTITGSVQLWHFFRDRARIKLTVQRNMEIIEALSIEKD